MDRYVLMLLDRFIARTIGAYRSFEFHIVYHELLQFCTVTLSAFYLDILKDRLYCSAPQSPERRSAQTVLYRATDVIVRIMAPILAFTAEEVWSVMPDRDAESVHMSTFPAPSGFEDPGLLKRWEQLRAIREDVNKVLEEARQRGDIGKALEAVVELAPTAENEELLRRYEDVLPELFIVSGVVLAPASPDRPPVVVRRADGEKCSRCWVVTMRPEEHDGGCLCPRCADVVGTLA
jgi:isoleucyl-tRNA synthetase